MATLDAWYPSLGLFAFDVAIIPIVCHILPGPIAPGSGQSIGATLAGLVVVIGILAYLIHIEADPYPYGILYSGALMVLCTETWFFEDPQLLNGSMLKGWPFFLFHQPGGSETKAPVPMTGFTRVFASWHAGGVCLSFFTHVLGNEFTGNNKASVSLALGLLWVIWAAINQWRAWYGAGQFCQMGIMFHALTGPGCGLAGYWMLYSWHQMRFGAKSIGEVTGGETVLLATFGIYVVATVLWLVTQERKEAIPDKKNEDGEIALSS